MPLLKRTLLTVAAVGALFIGLLGLLIPIIPGVLFLALAAILFAGVSSRFRAQLHRSSRTRPYLLRWEATSRMSLLTRAKAALLLLYAGVTDSLSRQHRS